MIFDFDCPVCEEITEAETSFEYITNDDGFHCKKCKTLFFIEIYRDDDNLIARNINSPRLQGISDAK